MIFRISRTEEHLTFLNQQLDLARPSGPKGRGVWFYLLSIKLNPPTIKLNHATNKLNRAANKLNHLTNKLNHLTNKFIR